MSRLERRDHGTGHSYFVDGVKVPGVTSALGVLAKPALTWWAASETAKAAVQERHDLNLFNDPDDVRVKRLRGVHDKIRRTAASEGSEVHDLVVQLVRGDPVDLPENPRVTRLTRAALMFMADWQFRPLLTEVKVWNEFPRYAGTLDLVGTSPLFPGRVFLADWKTNRGAIYPEAGLQLAAYGAADHYVDPVTGEDVDVSTLGITDHLVIHLHEDGYTVLRTSSEPEVLAFFLALLTVHRYRDSIYENGVLLGELPVPQVVAP